MSTLIKMSLQAWTASGEKSAAIGFGISFKLFFLTHEHSRPSVWCTTSARSTLWPRVGKRPEKPLNDLEISVRRQLINECCQALLEVIDLFGVEQIVCLGRFVEAKVKALVKNQQMDNVKVHFLVHLSPASPLANTGLDKIARKTFERLGLLEA